MRNFKYQAAGEKKVQVNERITAGIGSVNIIVENNSIVIYQDGMHSYQYVRLDFDKLSEFVRAVEKARANES